MSYVIAAGTLTAVFTLTAAIAMTFTVAADVAGGAQGFVAITVALTFVFVSIRFAQLLQSQQQHPPPVTKPSSSFKRVG